jgi:hypothetical protein
MFFLRFYFQHQSVSGRKQYDSFMSCIYSALNPLYLVSKLLGLAPYPPGKTGTAIPDVRTKRPFGFSTLYNYFVFLCVLSWLIFDITWDAIYKYPNLTSRNVIPNVIRTCTFKAAGLTALILCHRGSLRVFCSKIALVDKILLGKTASSYYKNTKLMLIIGMPVVLVSASLIALCDINVRKIDITCIVRVSVFVFGGAIGTLVIFQYFVCVLLLKNKFCKLNAQLTEMVVCDYDEESLETFASFFDQPNKMDPADSVYFYNGSQNLKEPDPLFLSLSKIRNHLFHHDRYRIRALRQTHGVLCDAIQMLNSDYGIQVLLVISYAFISFVMFTSVAMDARHDPSLADCDNEEPSCVRIIMNFCISCTCIIKVLSLAVSCHAASSEASRTSRIVQRLLSQRPIRADTLTELQLFSQQLWNIDLRFTAFGFFTLNLNLLCSVAATATTYIVVLLQLK